MIPLQTCPNVLNTFHMAPFSKGPIISSDHQGDCELFKIWVHGTHSKFQMLQVYQSVFCCSSKKYPGYGIFLRKETYLVLDFCIRMVQMFWHQHSGELPFTPDFGKLTKWQEIEIKTKWLYANENKHMRRNYVMISYFKGPVLVFH